jgi:pepF/M3 family oligoendopeptidase
MRKYDSVLDMTLYNSRMDRPTLDALLAAMRESLPIFAQYFAHKAKLLGHTSGLPFYDLFAPVGAVDMLYTKEQAAEFVHKQFAAFGSDLGDFATRCFEHNWIDWLPKDGKVGGAFCMNVHAIGQSRVLHNYDNSFSDVLTLAHELGHAYHGDALAASSLLNSRYSSPIAEVASTFCETLVCAAALKTAKPQERMVIIENSLQGSSQVIVDILSRFLFEDEIIRRRDKGSLSVDELKGIMLDAQKQAYGDSLSCYHPYMWACKGHYYNADNNYYNYAYAYGLLFAKGLYNIYLKEGAPFADKYRKLLTATGCNNLYDVGMSVGINVHDIEFWRGSLAVIKAEVEQFCKG